MDATQAALALCLAGALACGADPEVEPAPATPPPPAPPNLLLVVVDTLRADHVGAYGYARPTSPNIDILASRGTLFTHATAPSSWTKPSVGSLFTSRLPSEHGAVTFGQPLSAELPTLAELLRDAGYVTIGVTANFVHVNPHTGMARGFDHFQAKSVRPDEEREDPSWIETRASGDEIPMRERRAREVNRAVLERLDETPQRPFFLYVHYMDPHSSYAPLERFRKPFARDAQEHERRGPSASTEHLMALQREERIPDEAERRWLVDLYDAEIAQADSALGGLVKGLHKRGLWRNTLLVVVSDHGEEFGDHGGWFHGLTLQHESLAIPLILHDARNLQRDAKRDEPVDLLDVPTTLLHAAGVEPPAGMRGRSLLDDSLDERNVVAELYPDEWFEAGHRARLQRMALTRWPWKLILRQDGANAIYRLDLDPAERRALERDALPAELSVALGELESRLPSLEIPSDSPTLEPEYLEQLRALGYVE